jgi:hypothetical protein
MPRCAIHVVACVFALALASCAMTMRVHQEDMQSWVGVPVAELDRHPIFLTMQVVRTRTSDGTEIRNYVNGRNVASCSGGGSAFAGYVDMTTYSQFTDCMQTFAACNNIFYIKGGVVTQYSPIGTGGMRCYTTEQLRPGFVGAANVR